MKQLTFSNAKGVDKMQMYGAGVRRIEVFPCVFCSMSLWYAGAGRSRMAGLARGPRGLRS